MFPFDVLYQSYHSANFHLHSFTYFISIFVSITEKCTESRKFKHIFISLSSCNAVNAIPGLQTADK